MEKFRVVLRSACLFVLIHIANSSPPEDPIKCKSKNKDCIITNAYGNFSDRAICKAAKVEYPSTEEELIAVVAKATKQKTKMKVTTRHSHSTTKLVCPDGEDGLLISTNNLNRVIEIDVKSLTITVESGVTLRQLIDEAAKAGLALAQTPYWWGLTVGGVISTGAHGSTLLGEGSSVYDYVVALRIVSPARRKDGYAKARTLTQSDSELNAVKVSLGVLGVISQVTLKLEPMFKRSITYMEKNDRDLSDEAVKFGRKHEFADITWYPAQKKAVYRIDDRVSSNAPSNGLFDRTIFRSTSSEALAQSRATEENQEFTSNVEGKCNISRQTTSMEIASAYGLTNNGTVFTGYPVIGYQNRIQSAGTCLDSPEDALATACSWDPRIKGQYYFNTAFGLNLSKVKFFIQDVQKLVNLAPKSLCGLDLYVGIVLRYVKTSTAYLGRKKDGINFDINYYRSKDPMIPRLYQDIIEEIEQVSFFKYKALPHWGKNMNVAFDGAIRKYKNAGEFLKVKEKYDPDGLFSSEWTDKVLGLKGNVSVIKEGCALEGLCICSEDVHCAPEKGYFCRHGKIYKRARVCTFVPSIKKKN
ncbi:L-gulonolactone oxidase 5-like [Euphorbia lathyris]|uniref:L-gulonolactone oxidase 5-like n=1 Tax=Euphorbia lathyris TaxID=212925 RepID=UPI003313D3D0